MAFAGYIIEWKKYFVPGAQMLSSACIPQPLCDVCVVDDVEPDPDECSTTITPTIPDCDPFDPDCMPVWYLQEIISQNTALCAAIAVSYPDICDSTIGDTLPGLIPFGICCILDCLTWMVGRKGATDCITEADLPLDPPVDYPGTPEEWIRCRTALRGLLLTVWPAIGADLTLAYCLDQDLPPLFGSDQSSVVWQTIQLPGGSHLVESGCDTITFEAGCDECQPAP